ncbi:hypothetical protein ACV229_31525 [Burkholderia sp. MR1-5-21]
MIAAVIGATTFGQYEVWNLGGGKTKALKFAELIHTITLPGY